MSRVDEIADEIRLRIATGRLRPGDSVPSTRAIMRDHNVAMATAGRVLALLQRDGLVESKPGRGTVVLAPRGADPAVLTADGVVAVAVAIADAESLAGVSMRRLAAALGIATMAVYRYVPSREELESAMLDRVLGEVELPPASGAWRADLESAVGAFWQVMVKHPWLAGALSMTRPTVLPSAMPLSERMLAALVEVVGDPVRAFTDYLTILHFVRGVGLTLEPELSDLAETGLTNDEWIDTRLGDLRRVAPPDRFPTMNAIMARGYPYDADALFRSGLGRLLDGIAAGSE